MATIDFLNKVNLGNCMIEMHNIDDASIDCIICDPPYGVRDLDWDIKLSTTHLWKHYKRIIKEKIHLFVKKCKRKWCNYFICNSALCI